MKLLTFARTFISLSPRTILERLENPIKIAESSAVEKTFLSILYSGIISTPPPTPELLPGANTWNEQKHGAIIEKARGLLLAGATVCAICDATVVLANAGQLDHRKFHQSFVMGKTNY